MENNVPDYALVDPAFELFLFPQGICVGMDAQEHALEQIFDGFFLANAFAQKGA